MSSLAQAGGDRRARRRRKLLAACCAGVIDERVRVRDALLAAGYTVPPTQSNFVWLALGERTAPFAAHCLDHKVVVRPFHPDGVRVTVTDAGGERRVPRRRPVVRAVIRGGSLRFNGAAEP